MKQPNRVLTEAQELLKVWRDIDGKVSMGSMTAGNFETLINQFRDILLALTSLDAQISQSRRERDRLNKEVTLAISRVHSSMAGTYGKNSPQVAMVKTTRPASRRKKRDDSSGSTSSTDSNPTT